MSGGLILRLRPHEKFLVNGVIIENGDRRAKLRVKTQNASILRIRDALHPDEATTPAKRLYYIAQLAVAGEADEEAVQDELVPGLEALRAAFGDKICRDDLDQALADAKEGRFYFVMRALSKVMREEAALLSLSAEAPAQPSMEPA